MLFDVYNNRTVRNHTQRVTKYNTHVSGYYSI